MLEIDNNTALVLEGGGMRGVFTCGVLDYLMDIIFNFLMLSVYLLEHVMACLICRISEEEGNIAISIC